MRERIKVRASAVLARNAGEAGQGLAEYALILAFVALACVGALAAFGDAVRDSPGWKLFG